MEFRQAKSRFRLRRLSIWCTAILCLLLSIPSLGFAAQPSSGSQLASGKANKVGQVNVLNIAEAPGPEEARERPIPFLVPNPQAFNESKKQAEQPGFIPPGQGKKIIVTPSLAAAVSSLQVVSTLAGVSGSKPNPCKCSPPDVEMAVGPNHIFEIVNLAGLIYTKSGAVAKNTFPLSNFFLLPTSSMSDPQVIYDTLSGRWFASIVNVPGDSVQFAVSASNDPTGTWSVYSMPSTGYLTDQPFIGASDDKFVISVNDFQCVFLCQFQGTEYWAFNKSELVNGQSPVHFASAGPDPRFFSIHPARHLSSSSGYFYMVTVGSGSTSSAQLVTVTGVPPNPVTQNTYSFGINSLSNPPNALQPGTTTTLKTNDDRVLSAVWNLVSGVGTLWFAANDACRLGGDSTRSCLHLFDITTSGTTATNVQDFNYAQAGNYFFYPAVSLNGAGKLVIVYGRSSSTVYPSLYVTSLGTLLTPNLIKSGTKPDLSNRYGDYFEAAVDPTASGFWVAGEYRVSSTFQSWSTAIAKVTVA